MADDDGDDMGHSRNARASQDAGQAMVFASIANITSMILSRDRYTSCGRIL